MLCLFSSYASTLSAQSEIVTGVITDSNTKEPLIGAAIQVVGTTISTATNDQGLYSIKVAPKQQLKVAYIGYNSEIVAVGDRKVINLSLRETANSLEDVVVIGYGAIQKRDITGSISSISAKDIGAKAPVDVFDALQGLAAGLQITSASGEPGSGSDIRIRGTSTFGSGAIPLYVVDGMPMDDISAINPSDITSAEILKDAASASIYGSRSANGVIIITTKKGESGKAKFDVKYLGSLSNVKHLLPATTPDQMRYLDINRNRLGATSLTRSDSLNHFLNFDGDLASLIFRTSQKHQVDLSASGKSDRMNYYLSAGYYGEDGVIINSKFQRTTLRLNTQYNATDRLTIGNRIQLGITNQKGVSDTEVVQAMYDWVPYYNPFDANGNIMHNMGGKNSPYAIAESIVSLKDTYRASVFNFVEFKISEDLKFTSNLSGDLFIQRNFYYKPQILQSNTGRTEGRDEMNLRYNYLTENLFNYNKKIKDHSFTAMLGMSAQFWREEAVSLRGYDYVTDYIYTLNAASLIETSNSNSNIEKHTMVSGFARGTYSYKGKYLFAGNVRYDGSSRFGSSNRWGAFPSGSVAWRISDESFMRWAKGGLDDAKFRFSYGVTGNEQIGNYDSWQLYETGNLYMGISGIAPIRLGNSGLGWEKTAQTNVGTDLTFWRNRVIVTADYYVKNTTELLYPVELPKESGYTTMYKNIGAMRNSGFELSVDFNIIKKKDWDWRVNFNYSSNNAIIKKLADGVPFYTGTDNAIFIYESARIGEFWGFRHDGVFSYDQSNAFTPSWDRLTPIFNNGTFGGYTYKGEPYSGAVAQKLRNNGEPYKAGDVNWLEAPGSTDGIIDEKDKFFLGCAQPDFYGGFNSTLRYKAFTFSFQLNFNIGGQVYNRAAYNRNNFGTSVRAPEPKVIANMWLYPGDNAIYPTPNPANGDNRLGPSDYWIEDGSYVKLKNVRLTYNLPEKWCKTIYMKQIQAYVYGNNLMTFSKYNGFDPEFGGSSPLTFGIDLGRYPRKTELGFGANLTFN